MLANDHTKFVINVPHKYTSSNIVDSLYFSKITFKDNIILSTNILIAEKILIFTPKISKISSNY